MPEVTKQDRGHSGSLALALEAHVLFLSWNRGSSGSTAPCLQARLHTPVFWGVQPGPGVPAGMARSLPQRSSGPVPWRQRNGASAGRSKPFGNPSPPLWLEAGAPRACQSAGGRPRSPLPRLSAVERHVSRASVFVIGNLRGLGQVIASLLWFHGPQGTRVENSPERTSASETLPSTPVPPSPCACCSLVLPGLGTPLCDATSAEGLGEGGLRPAGVGGDPLGYFFQMHMSPLRQLFHSAGQCALFVPGLSAARSFSLHLLSHRTSRLAGDHGDTLCSLNEAWAGGIGWWGACRGEG